MRSLLNRVLNFIDSLSFTWGFVISGNLSGIYGVHLSVEIIYLESTEKPDLALVLTLELDC